MSRGLPISTSVPGQLVAALGGVAALRFVPSREVVIVTRNGCGSVRDGGMLVTLGPVVGSGARVQVGVNGYVGCDGATRLTYVVDRVGTGWVISGTTGPRAIS